ncbi:MAG TPA: radical SAM protein [Desulfomonilaceae bacterium]|nr:radical SAM protein [Desulfomonilaceae bacterium]
MNGYGPATGWGRIGILAKAGIKYVTPKKMLNFVRCELDVLRRNPGPKSMPYSAVIDVTNICNLKCPYCPTGARRKSGRTHRMVDPAAVEKLLNEIGDYLISVNLYDWGEPFLHPRIVDLVQMCHDRGIFTMISSNMNTLNQQLMDEVCEAGLDYLVVSLSGTTQEVYQKYHRGGRIERLIENVRHISEFKKKHALKTPIIEFHYLVFKNNQQEVPAARDLARRLGVQIFRALPAVGPEEETVQLDNDPKKMLSEVQYCHQLWHLAVITPDSSVAPCYYTYFNKDDFAHYSEGDIVSIRNNHLFVTARKLFNRNKTGELPPKLEHPCLKCHLVHSQAHLKDYLKGNPHANKEHRTGGP